MDLPQAADALGLAASTLRWQIKNRKLRARKMGGRWYISAEEVEVYRKLHKQQPKELPEIEGGPVDGRPWPPVGRVVKGGKP